MVSFLEKIADEVLKNGMENLSEVFVVFPSRRAGIYFRDILSKKLKSPIWSPTILSIEDFLKKYSKYTIADRLFLIFELHKLFNQEESFDRFYSWGDMVLKDFDDTDKYLVDADLLFKKIIDYKEIEETFPVEMQEDFKKFWSTILDGNTTDLKNDFVKIWEMMGDVYNRFRESLKEQGIAYEGMAHRDICERFKNNEIKIDWNRIYFAGFNSLNKCEEEIINKLVKDGKAEIFWDCDNYYIEDEIQEAGYFLRKNFKSFKIDKPHWIDNNLQSEKKILNVTGIPLKVGEAKLAGSIIKNLSEEKDFVPEKTAIVIVEENMILPVLYSLPDSVPALNVTMGFRFKSTPLYNLLQILKSLQNNLKSSGGRAKFYHKDVSGILLHPYIKIFNPDYSYNLYRRISKENFVYLGLNDLIKEDMTEIFKAIFRDAGDITGIFNYLRMIIEMISDKFEKEQTAYEKFQLEYIYTLILQLNRFEDILNKYKTSITEETFWKILVDILGNVSIPLTGEPLKGLQIMGLLETRAIDFDNVIILSMNEGVIPAGKVQNSFIPYPFRKAFRMPVYQDNDAITAYYIFRLMQKAKNINLIYNTEADESSGEISRYLLQIEYELAKFNNNITFSHSIASTEAVFIKKKKINVKKSNDILKQLQNIKGFSATAISDYLNCKLQFYLKRIARLKEEEDVLEILDSASLGSVLHKVMEILYTPYLNKLITNKELEIILKRLDLEYDSIFIDGLKSLRKENIDINMQGRNILIKSIIRKLAERIIKKDNEYAPFTIAGLELNLKGMKKVNDDIMITLTGKIDRLEKKDDVYRIIDYKTSACEIKKLNDKSESEFFEKLISNSTYKETFQTLFYSYLFLEENPGTKVNPGLYLIRDSKKFLQFVKENSLDVEEIKKFGITLNSVLEELFNPEIEFTQTEDESRCVYCDFKSICYRE
jgi:CRISPR/Cas system-associated exonuclease Cas4 (RecB family)